MRLQLESFELFYFFFKVMWITKAKTKNGRKFVILTINYNLIDVYFICAVYSSKLSSYDHLLIHFLPNNS